jgi:hypothetical protein
MVGHVRQAGEDVAQVGVGIEAATTTAFDQSVDDSATLTGAGLPDKQPVFLVMRSSA